jgi:AbrB family looped-hinge helix DNA binding protein
MAHIATISSKGQMVIPAELRKEMGLKAGFRVNIVRKGNELIVSRRNLDAVLALGGKYSGMALEETLIEEKQKERAREDKKLEAF